MKVSCVLASFNRPTWLRQAIQSVADQTHKDYQLVVVDESTLFDVKEILAEFSLTEVHVEHSQVDPAQRAKQNRLSINCNLGLARAIGDLVCFLGDDDYLYPEWFAHASAFFETNPSIKAGFGRLIYHDSRDMVFPEKPAPVNVRFFPGPVDPFDRVDHNQGIHRRLAPPCRWPEDPGSIGGPDAYYFREVSRRVGPFHPIDALAAVKRVHQKNLQNCMDSYRSGSLEETRE